MNLVVDIGNSSTKLGVFEGNGLIAEHRLKDLSDFSDLGLLETYSFSACIISSVGPQSQTIESELNQWNISLHYLDHTTQLPFVNRYSTPESLGKDRLAAVAGGVAMFPGNDLLIVDAGTAINYELFSSKEGYLGGNISPGLEMRFRALREFTARLPEVSRQEEYPLIGQTTHEAIAAGVAHGLVFEIEGYLTNIRNKYPQITVILTGGDAAFFDNKLKNAIFVVQNLTLVGLNYILNYNAKIS